MLETEIEDSNKGAEVSVIALFGKVPLKDSTSGKHHLSFCTFSHLNNFLLRCDKIKYFITAFSVLFLLISCRKVSKNFYVLCDKKCDK